MNLDLKPYQASITVGNVIELAAAVGGAVVIFTTSFKSSPVEWQFIVNNIIGAGLILLAMFLYYSEKRNEVRANLIHGAFTAITQIQQRSAEQLGKLPEESKVVSVVGSIDKGNSDICSLLKDLLGGKV